MVPDEAEEEEAAAEEEDDGAEFELVELEEDLGLAR